VTPACPGRPTVRAQPPEQAYDADHYRDSLKIAQSHAFIVIFMDPRRNDVGYRNKINWILSTQFRRMWNLLQKCPDAMKSE